ncbi:MAG: OB-fold domain-containing protein [Hyphomicrobiales bacterium]|nr:OB-fold domain-containing protein [Hyphomicrobiales bacterium]
MNQTERKPSPIRTEGTDVFFDGLNRGQLMIQFCRNCEQYNISGHHFCPCCFAQTQWRPSEGLGKVVSYSIVHLCTHTGFKSELPFAVAEVALREGPSLSLRVIGEDANNIRIGQELKVEILDDGRNEATPVWTTL